MYYKFTCKDCSNDWTSNIGAYPVRFITCEPCPKCKTGTISAEAIKDTVIVNTGKSATLSSGTGEINSKLPSDFRDFMQTIKKGSPGCNMKDYK